MARANSKITKERKVNATLNRAYQGYKARRSMSIDERHATAHAYADYSINNTADHGGKGKAFEVVLRLELNPNTAVLKCQKQGLKDISLKVNGSMVNIECKTGGGEIANGLEYNTTDEWRNDWNPSTIKADYIAYCTEWTNDGDVYTDAIIFTKQAFINWAENWKGGWQGFFTYKPNEGRVMIQNPKAGKARQAYFEGIVDLIGEDGVYDLTEFKALIGR